MTYGTLRTLLLVAAAKGIELKTIRDLARFTKQMGV